MSSSDNSIDKVTSIVIPTYCIRLGTLASDPSPAPSQLSS